MPFFERDKAEITQPFLSDTESDHSYSNARSDSCSLRTSPVRIHVVIALVYTILLSINGALWLNYQPCRPNKFPYSKAHIPVSTVTALLIFLLAPARNVLKYHLETIEPVYDGNPFAGDPRPEHDKAWSDILQSEPKLQKKSSILQTPSADVSINSAKTSISASQKTKCTS